MSDHLFIAPEGSIEFVRWEQPVMYTWKPRPDITVYELAMCLGPLLNNSAIMVMELPQEAQRHFEKVDENTR